QTGMIGVFASLDFFLFYVFWEVMLVPMYFLIGVWGSDRRLYAAIKFFLYTLAGSVVMLLAILALYFYAPVAAGATRTFDVPTLLDAAQKFSDPLKVWLFWGFFFSFAIKVPMFPSATSLFAPSEFSRSRPTASPAASFNRSITASPPARSS